VLTGDDPVALHKAALAVENDLRTIPGLGSVASSVSLIRPEIAVRPDFARAADLGVSSAAIGDTLRIATLGDYDVSLPKLNLSQRQVPIVVRLEDSARSSLPLLERLTVPGTRGPVMQGQVATLEMTGGPAVIDRYDRARNVTFEIELSGLPLGDVKTAVERLPAVKQLPPGVKIIEIGDAEVMGELFARFGLAMLTGVLCIYIVLVLLFKDFLHPVTILCALPLSLGGACRAGCGATVHGMTPRPRHRPSARPPSRQERRLRAPDGHLAWAGLCSALALAGLAAQASARPMALIWYVAAWPQHPWMLWTASLIHLSGAHLLVNLGGLLVIAVLGVFLRAQWPATLAVLLAWPLGTRALAWWPDVAYYAGMSGLLMAMLAVLCVQAATQAGARAASVVLFLVLALKLLSERAWSQPLAFDPYWGFNVVNAAHLSGALAGGGCALVTRSAFAMVTRAKSL
jgi:rhomboid family GlyGly-CTERM serine protease